MIDRLEAVRASTARVVEHARFVRLCEAPLRTLAEALALPAQTPTALDPAHHHQGSDADILAYVLTLDAVNFGSGYFPELAKRPGLSGYLTIATHLKEHFEREGPFSAASLRTLTAARCAQLFGQELVGQEIANPVVAELMGLFAAALGELGVWLEARHAGRFEGPVEVAGGRAAALVELLCEMPMYRDVARYAGQEVAFYKRAQITVCDLHAAFAGHGPGRFDDIDRLTSFADNLVPHVLRCEGVLEYVPELAARIDAGRLLESGSPEEVELRASAVVAVERMVDHLRARGVAATAQRIDTLLWSRGQSKRIKARPRHRTRCCFY